MFSFCQSIIRIISQETKITSSYYANHLSSCLGIRFAPDPLKTVVSTLDMPKWQDNRLCDAKKSDLQVRLDSRMKLQFCGSKVTSDARLLAPDEALRFTEMGTDLLTDSRRDCNKQHLLVPLLRQSIYSRLAGYEEANDTERLAVDPARCHVVGGRQHRRTTKLRPQAASVVSSPRFSEQPNSVDEPVGQLDRQGPAAPTAPGIDSRIGQFRQ